MPDWKGMFKKGAELAQQAKSEIERSGLLDQARSSSSPSSAPPSAPADPAAQVREVIGPDHPDPFTLVTTADVQAAFGATSVSGPTATYSDNSGGPAWTLQTPAGEISVDVYLYADPYDIEELLGYGDDEVQRLADVEDRAAIAGDMAAVQRGGETLTISVIGGEPVHNAAALQQLARSAAARLPSFTSYAARMSLPGGPVIPDILSREFLAEVVGTPFDVPTFDRDDNELDVQWQALDAPPDEYGEPGSPLTVSVTSYVVDPWDLQKQQADAGGVWAKAAVEIGEAMKQQFAEHIKPTPGPWDEGYVGSDQVYFKKNGKSFTVKIGNTETDQTEQVDAIARRLAEAL